MSDPGERRAEVDRQLRGSSLLLAGRLLSKAVNFGVQVAIIRMLTKDDFGAFAYGLALVAAGELLVKLGLGQGANRFVPYYFERGEHAQMLGTLSLVTAMIAVLGTVGFGALWWISSLSPAGFPGADGRAVVLLLAWLAPIQALDQVCVQTLACFSRPWQILIRKHVLGPAFRVLAVLVAFVAGGSPAVLAGAYLAGGLIALLISLHLVVKELYAHGVLPRPIAQWRTPWSELVGYSLPLVSSDLVAVVLTGVTTVLVMATSGEAEVASLRAVTPAAALNLLVVQSFGILFLPGAARLFARNDMAGLNQHYWESVGWVAVLSFPIFAATFCVAPKLVVLLFGAPYAESATVLAILSVGSFAGVVTAFSSESLQVLKRTRVLLWSNIAVMVVSVALAALLCPEFGALGAAVAVTVARILGVTIRQTALMRSREMRTAPHTIRDIWAKLFLATTAASIVGWIWQPAFVIQGVLLVIVCLWLLRACARAIDIGRTFPELMRVPLLGRWMTA